MGYTKSVQPVEKVFQILINKLFRWCFKVKLINHDDIGALAVRFHFKAFIDGLFFYLDNDLLLEKFKGLMVVNIYEDDERHLTKEYLDKNSPVIELGASIGVISCIVNSRLKSPQKHVVVEANPKLIPTLKKNRDMNGCQFTIIEAAIGYGGETVTFFSNGLSLVGSIYLGGGDKWEIPARTLQSIATEAGFDRFTLVSDIEGSEIGMVEHEIDFIREHVTMIMMEIHEETPYGASGVQQTLQRLINAGFRLVAHDGNNYCLRNKAFMQVTWLLD